MDRSISGETINFRSIITTMKRLPHMTSQARVLQPSQSAHEQEPRPGGPPDGPLFCSENATRIRTPSDLSLLLALGKGFFAS